MRHRLLKWLAPLVALSLLAGACGGDDDEGGGLINDVSDDPQQAFEDALDALAEYQGVRLVLSLESTAEDLAALGESEDDRIPEDVAEKILNSSLTIAATGNTPETAQADLAVNVDGNEDAVQLRVRNEALYVRAEVRDLFAAFGGDTSELDTVAEESASQPGLEFIGPAIDGAWIGIENINELGETLTGSPAPAPDEEELGQVGEQLSAILKNNASVTSVGTDDVGAHLAVNVPLRETVEEFLAVLSEVGGLPEEASPDTSELPSGDLTIDAWVNDGQLVQLELDILKMGPLIGEEPPADVGRLAVQIGLSEFTGGVEVPPDAIIIDPEQVLSALFGGFAPPTDF